MTVTVAKPTSFDQQSPHDKMPPVKAVLDYKSQPNLLFAMGLS